MTLTRSLPTQHPSGLPLIDERRITVGRYVRTADGTARPGILPAHTSPLVTGRASMGYDVAAFNALTVRTNAGAEEIANDASTIVTTTTAPGANTRIDVIWVRAQFVILGDANNDVVFGVTQGAANIAPTKPAIPAGALELATATIPSTATTTLSSGVVITQTYLYTAPVGGIVWLRSQPEQDAWAPVDGSRAYRIDTGVYIDRVAGAWVPNETGSMVVRPTSIVGGTQNADGSVSFASAASVSLNGIFTSRFREYEIRYQTTTKTLSAGIEIRLRAGGTDSTTANYFWRRVGMDGSTVSQFGTTSGASFEPDFNAYPVIVKSLRLLTPHLPVNTVVWSAGGLETDNNLALLNAISFAGTHKVASAFDGITLRVATGTLTGSVVVIGHR